MEESAIITKAEKYLNNLDSEKLDFKNLENFDTFKSVYFRLCDRLDHLQEMKNIMDSQGYTAPFRSLNKYGVNVIDEVTVEERRESSRHNQYFRTKAVAKKNILDRVSSAIDSHKIAIGNLEEYSNLKCKSCYKTYRINEYKDNDSRCSCKSTKFSFKINNDRTHRIGILPYLPYSGNYMVLRTKLSNWGRNAFQKVIKILKQERRGVVKTISMSIRYKDKNDRILHKNISLDSDFLDDYEEEVRRQYGKDVRIERLSFHRSKPAIISENIVLNIQDSFFKKRLTDFKRLNNYEHICDEINSQNPDFLENPNDLEDWRQLKIKEKLKSIGYIDKFDNLNRVLKRDLNIKENTEKTIFTNLPSALIIWDIFKYYLTSSNNRRRKLSSPFPYIRVELDRQQRSIFQKTYKKVIRVLADEAHEKIISIENMDLILYEKFKLEKLIKNSNMKINYPALGAALINLNSDIDIENIGNSFDVNVSKIKKEINNIEIIKKPKSEKSKKFLELIKK